MATSSSPGIGSGLDINSIVSQLVAIERQPILQLQTQATQLQAQLSIYGQVKSNLSTLRDALSALTGPSLWAQTVGSSSDPAAVAVTTGSATAPGSYSVEVSQLAQAQSNATAIALPSADSLVGEGTLRIELGTWGPGQTSFTPKSGATAVDITVGPPEKSLAQLRDAINAANAGVTASILTDASGARLVLRSASTGEMNGFRVSVTDGDGNHTDGVGLSALAFDPSAGILTMAQAVAAMDAAALINGMPVKSASNTLSNVVDGLTLTLGKKTATPVTVAATQDNAAIRKAVDALVTAYNDLNKLLAEQTKYDADTKTAGKLQGDTAATGLRSQLRSVLGLTSGASAVFTRLSDIGFDILRDGSLKLDATRFDNALANLPETRKLFANSDSGTPANDGIARQLRGLVDAALSVEGVVSSRTDGLRRRVDLNQDRQERLEDRVAMVEKRLRAQYTALDKQMAQLNGLSSYITQQVSAWSANNKN